MNQCFSSLLSVALLLVVILGGFEVACGVEAEQAAPNGNNILLDGKTPPKLNGQHFKFTVVEDDGWVNIEETNDGTLTFSGYCIDIIENIAKRANFTYELHPPSGFGKECSHPIEVEDGKLAVIPYDKHYQGQYLCGQGDVQENITRDEYTTDFYQSLFYVTPKRQLSNRFTLPFIPPTFGGIQLFGTATGISDIFDLIQQQKSGTHTLPVCLKGNTAAALYIQNAFPDLQTTEKSFKSSQDVYSLIEEGECELLINDYPFVTRTILKLSESNQCVPNGLPVGVVGSPLLFGFNQFAIGIRQDLPAYVDRTFNYWMNELMTCSPGEASCNSFSEFYPEVGGIGDECGYNPNPIVVQLSDEGGVDIGLIVGITAAFVGLFLMGVVAYIIIYRVKRLQRIRTRFVQQVSRTIDIGESPDHVSAGQMNELFKCITGATNDDTTMIKEVDFRKWMANDAKLEYLSESDLKVLWDTLDQRGKGYVTQMDFISFLNKCEIEFEEVGAEKNCMIAALETMANNKRSLINL